MYYNYLHPSGCSSVTRGFSDSPDSTSIARFKMFSVRSNSILVNQNFCLSTLFRFRFVNIQSKSKNKLKLKMTNMIYITVHTAINENM